MGTAPEVELPMVAQGDLPRNYPSSGAIGRMGPSPGVTAHVPTGPRHSREQEGMLLLPNTVVSEWVLALAVIQCGQANFGEIFS